ncbi:MAG: HD-GYP domain-containing protein [Chloroflexota bacterium]
MTRNLKLYIAGVVAMSVVALIATTFLLPIKPDLGKGFSGLGEGRSEIAGLIFWCVVAIGASALPVQMPRGTLFFVNTAPIIAATFLGGPTAGAWVALIGVTEVRELRGRIPWYGSLANHAGFVLPAVAAGLVMSLVDPATPSDAMGLAGLDPVAFLVVMAGSFVFTACNIALASGLAAMRTEQRVRDVLIGDLRGSALSYVGMAPIGWLMAVVYRLAWWASLIFAIPLYTTRRSYQDYTEIREMFTQTITALAGAVDKRDPFTSKHSWNVKAIAADIGREMRLGEVDLEALEWGGLLHDVGKIGVPDAVLLKAERLTKEERMQMNSHPVLGAQIIAPVTRLSRELPIIRNHHEWYNGSGYPDRLIGDEIPLLARILHVADAFEAMTAQRPYRMVPLTREQALGELRKFAGIQFDPRVVDAFVKTKWVEGVPDPGRPTPPRPIPLISQHASQMTAQHPAPTALQTATASSPAAQSPTPTSPTA